MLLTIIFFFVVVFFYSSSHLLFFFPQVKATIPDPPSATTPMNTYSHFIGTGTGTHSPDTTPAATWECLASILKSLTLVKKTEFQVKKEVNYLSITAP